MKPNDHNGRASNGAQFDRLKESDNALVFSYLTMRNLIGFSGMLLPFVLMFATATGPEDKAIEASISNYYYTSNGDVLVVVLSILGVFLFTYGGYTWKEWALTTLAALCAVGVAFSPTATDAMSSYSIHVIHNQVPMILGIERHFWFAATFFLAVALMSLIYFPKTDASATRTQGGKRTQKAKRNMVYRACGLVIIACLVVLALYFIIKFDVGDFPIVFVFEAIAVEAFGFAWITKGETLWPDGEHYVMKGIRALRGVGS